MLHNFHHGLARAERPAAARFLLDPQLDAILSAPVQDNAYKFDRLAGEAHRVMREARMALLIRRYYRGTPVPWPKLA